MRRKNIDGSPWCPKPSDLICSAHFIGNVKSDDQLSSSYIPTIFPHSVYKTRKINQTTAINRHKRFIRRRNAEKESSIKSAQIKIQNKELIDQSTDNIIGDISGTALSKMHSDQECQVEMFSNFSQSANTFVCNTYIYNNTHCDAEIQTEIMKNVGLITICNKKNLRISNVAHRTKCLKINQLDLI